MTVVLFLGGIQLMTLGVMGEYLGRVFNETKRRPLYIVERFSPSHPGGTEAAQFALPAQSAQAETGTMTGMT